MEDTSGLHEAEAEILQLLDAIEWGKAVTITRPGVPVATLVPIETRRRTPAGAIDEWLAYRKKENIRLNGLSIREMIEEGRRPSPSCL